MNVVILGATRGIGRALARLLAQREDRLFLLGRNAEQLECSARDLELRGAPAPVETAVCDLNRHKTFTEVFDRAEQALGKLEVVLVTAALCDTQQRLESYPAETEAMLDANFTGTVLFCEEARRRLLAGGGGTLCVFGSVAGDRARKPVILYGASKAGLAHYLEGLDHKFRTEGLKTICVKPGFVRTSMTAGLDEPPFSSEAGPVARRVLRAIDRGSPVVYAPPIWRLVMGVIRRLPRRVMRKVGF